MLEVLCYTCLTSPAVCGLSGTARASETTEWGVSISKGCNRIAPSILVWSNREIYWRWQAFSPFVEPGVTLNDSLCRLEM